MAKKTTKKKTVTAGTPVNVKPKPTFQATSMSKVTTPLIPDKTPRMPVVHFDIKAWFKMWKLVELCDGEVGWLGLVDELAGGDYLITDIFIPEQVVSGATTDIESDAVANLAVELESQGIDSTKLRYWGHSHVNMQVSPSGTDEAQLADYMEHCDWFIRGIYNKKKEYKLDVFDKRVNCVFQKCDHVLHNIGMEADWVDKLKKQINNNVKKYVSPKTFTGRVLPNTPNEFYGNDYSSIWKKNGGKRWPY